MPGNENEVKFYPDTEIQSSLIRHSETRPISTIHTKP